MRKTNFFLCLALLAASPAAAFQPQDWSEYSTKETRALMHAYAKCVVARQPRKAAEALIANVDNKTILKNYQMLLIGDCLVRETHAESRMSFKGDLYRYALADALFSRELAAQPAPDLASVPKLDHRDPGAEPGPLDAHGKKLSKRMYEEALAKYRERLTFYFLSQYGECVVRLAPVESRDLLRAAPDSKEESARFGALRTALATCMPEGRTIRFGRVALRGSIAINYYRLAHAAQAAAM